MSSGRRRQSGFTLIELLIVVAIIGVSILLTPGAVRRVGAEIPTTADFAACNDRARQVVRAGSASPVRGDHARAERARSAAVSASPDLTGNGVESPDPQIHGMEPEGAKDAAFQAAYRGCMRQKGF